MAKTVKKSPTKKPSAKGPIAKSLVAKSPAAKSPGLSKKAARALLPAGKLRPASATPSEAVVLDHLHATIASRRGSDPSVSHSARLLSRGTAKVAQKFGEEAVECLIEAVAGNRSALVAESADVLYHLLVLWVDAGVEPHEVWSELERRQGVSGVAEKAARAQKLSLAFGLGTTKIP